MKRASRAGSDLSHERRARAERRHRKWWSVFYGNFNPRRRTPPRRLDDSHFHWLDWHSSHLLAVAIGILLLSVTDAFLTVVLLQGGAEEVNPVMAALVYRSVAVFTALKMAMTGASVMLMVSTRNGMSSMISSITEQEASTPAGDPMTRSSVCCRRRRVANSS